MSKERIQELCDYIDRNKVRRHLIDNTKLKEQPDHVVHSYFKMLAVILQAGIPETAQIHFFQRLVLPFIKDITIEDYLRRALEVEIEDYEDFIANFKDSQLKYRFAVDALLLSALNQTQDEQISLVAQLLDSLDLEKIDVEYITDLARSILEQDSDLYYEAEDKRPAYMDFTLFLEYIRLYVGLIICNTEALLLVEGVGRIRVELPFEKAKELLQGTHKYAILKNLIVTGFRDAPNFNHCEKVHIDDCYFHTFRDGDAGCSISFQDCTNVLIENSRFKNFVWHCLTLYSVENLQIKNCIFEDIQKKYTRNSKDWIPYGMIVWSMEKAPESVLIEDCEFRNCKEFNSANYWSKAIICDVDCMVNHCKFYDCWSYHSDDEKDDVSQQTLFTDNSTGEGNILKYCAKFN